MSWSAWVARTGHYPIHKSRTRRPELVLIYQHKLNIFAFFQKIKIKIKIRNRRKFSFSTAGNKFFFFESRRPPIPPNGAYTSNSLSLSPSPLSFLRLIPYKGALLEPRVVVVVVVPQKSRKKAARCGEGLSDFFLRRLCLLPFLSFLLLSVRNCQIETETSRRYLRRNLWLCRCNRFASVWSASQLSF